MSHDSYPRRAGGLGQLGEGVPVDFTMAHGSRAQKRQLARFLERQKTSEATANKKKVGKK